MTSTYTSGSDGIITSSNLAGPSLDTSLTLNTLQLATDVYTGQPASATPAQPAGPPKVPGRPQTSAQATVIASFSQDLGQGTPVPESVSSLITDTTNTETRPASSTLQEGSQSLDISSISSAASPPPLPTTPSPPGIPGTLSASSEPTSALPQPSSVSADPASAPPGSETTLTFQTLVVGESVTSISAVPTPPLPPKPPGVPGRVGTTTSNVQSFSLYLDTAAPVVETPSSISTSGFQTSIAGDSVTSILTIPPAVKPTVIPGGQAGTTTDVQSFTFNLGNTDVPSGVLPILDTSLTLQTLDQGESVTSVYVPTGTHKPPSIPGRPTTTVGVSVDPVDTSNTSSETSVVSQQGLQFTQGAGAGTSAYTYPGQFGAGGSLTTDTDAPTRTVLPTRTSIVPNLTTRVGPPPADTWVPPPEDTAYQPPPDDDPTAPETTTIPTRKPSRPPISRSSSQPLSYVSAIVTTSERGGVSTWPSGLPEVPSASDFSTSQDFILVSGSVVFLPTETTDTPSITSVPALNATSIPTYPNSTDWGNWSMTVSSATTWSFTTGLPYTTDERGSTVSYCDPTDTYKPSTTYSVVYTSTITWYGDPTDYTPPFPPISTPDSCSIPKTPVRLTLSECRATGTSSKYVTCTPTTALLTYTTAVPAFSTTAPTITFVTTDKNPAVVYSTIETPNYGVSQPVDTKNEVGHSSATPDPQPGDITYNTAQTSSGGHSPPAQNTGKQPASVVLNPAPSTPTPIPITIRPTVVIISSTTITNNPASPTQTVVSIGGDMWTVNPSQVVGGGQTVTRPNANGGVYVPSPTSTTVGGIAVTVSSSVAVIGGTTLTLGPSTIITSVGGQTVSAGPAGVTVGSATIQVVAVPSQTQVVVEGGGLITAIGPSVVVIQSTTITYGPGVTYGGSGTFSSTTLVGADTITIGSLGVSVHGTTIGGPSVSGSSTQYEIVGGATITQIGASVIVVGSSTYTVGPGTGTETGIGAGTGAGTGAGRGPGSTIAVVGGSTITVPPHTNPITTILGGHTITLPPTSEPSTTVLGGETVTILPHSQTLTTVIGGATATIPPHSTTVTTVIGGSTITFAPASTTSTTLVAGQTLTIPPHSSPLTTVVGGQTLTLPPNTAPITTTVGGQTLTLPPSPSTIITVVGGRTSTIPPHSTPLTTVFDGTTVTFPPGTGYTTTVIGGETVTIGPSGVSVLTHTMGWPFGGETTVTITPTPTPTDGSGGASETGDSEDAGGVVRPAWGVLVGVMVGLVGLL